MWTIFLSLCEEHISEKAFCVGSEGNWKTSAVERRFPGSSILQFVALDSSVSEKPDEGKEDVVLA